MYLADSWRCPIPWFTLLDRQSPGKIEGRINVSWCLRAMIFSLEQNTDDVSYLALPNQYWNRRKSRRDRQNDRPAQVQNVDGVSP